MNIYVINLERSKERRERMEERLKGQKNVTWLPTIPAESELRIPPEITNITERRIAANAWSHWDIWAGAKACADSFPILVLEDDVLFRWDWERILQEECLPKMDEDWDLLMLNAQGFISWEEHGLRRISQDTTLLLAGAYLLSKKGCEKLLNMNFGPLEASDYRLARLQKFGKSYFYFPFLAMQECYDSIIGGNDNQKHVLDMKEWQEKNYRPNFKLYYPEWQDKNIVLVIMVKNESKIVGRCIESVSKFISKVIVCDTGSTDGTQQLVTNFCKQKNLPLYLFSEPFKNFEYNRTRLLQVASERVNISPSTYFLLLDADMVWVGGEPPLALKNFDLWHVQQRNSGDTYWNARLVRSTIRWKYTGVTHEYLEAEKGPVTETRLSPSSEFYIDDRNDGGSKGDKSERDIRLLQEGLKMQPRNERYMFYLANTLRETGRYLEALPWYKRHRTISTWDEERWYALYNSGLCYEALNCWDKAQNTFLQAYNERPQRAEPLYQIARHYRFANQPKMGFPFALAAYHIPYPEGERLFVNRGIYEYGCLEELSIVSYYVVTNEPICRQTTYKMLSKPNVPFHIRDTASYNLRFVMQPISVALKWEELVGAENWQACNPSILFRENGQRITNVRLVNYKQNKARNYQVPAGGVIQTENFYQGSMLKCEWKGEHWNSCHIRGLEDIRMFWRKEQIWATATSLETTSQHIPQIVLFQIQEGGEVTTVQPLHFQELKTEKNWLLFEENGELLVVYKYSPLTILKVVDDGKCELKCMNVMPLNVVTSHFKGGGICRLPNGSGYLVVVHETIDRPDERRYWHRILILGPRYEWRIISQPFYFRYAEGVEFCSSVAIFEDTIYFGIGEEDRKAAITSASLTDILQFATATNEVRY